MAAAIRAYPWHTTPLGAIEQWSPALLTTLNLILESPSPSLLMWGPEMVLLYNDPFIPLLTDRHPAALGSLGREVWTDVWPVVGEQLESVLRDGVNVRFQAALVPIMNNGVLEDTYFDYTYSPVFELDGSIGGLLDVCQDVTSTVIAEQKREAADSALQEQRTRLLNVLQQAPLFFALLEGPEHVFTMANPLYLKLVGGRDIMRKSVGDALPEVVEQGYVRMLDEVCRTGDPLSQQGAAVDLAIREGGPLETRFLDFTYQPLREADGSVSGIIVVGIDRTEAKLAEKALLQSEKLAAVGRLAATIAHEINNPLESVTNLLYLARGENDLKRTHDFLDTAEVELRRVSSITRQTLSFHRVSSAPRTVTCEELLGSVLSMYQGRVLNAGIRIEKRKRAAHPVLCNDGEIRQVLNNLVSNAIDAMQTEGGRLIVRSRDGVQWSTGKRGLVLTVADTGSGISPESLRRIFEPFYTTKGLNGTGLGLWLSHDIVARHGGDMRVRSCQGQPHGTVFTVFLPYESLLSAG